MLRDAKVTIEGTTRAVAYYWSITFSQAPLAGLIGLRPI